MKFYSNTIENLKSEKAPLSTSASEILTSKRVLKSHWKSVMPYHKKFFQRLLNQIELVKIPFE